MAAQILTFPTSTGPIAIGPGQAVLFQGVSHTVEKVYETRALISGPRGERIARIGYLEPLPAANR